MDIKDLPYILTVAYLIIISIIGFILPPVDKSKARKNKWRIRERTLFIVSALGGSVAMYISMRIFHHKTKHKRFMIGIPVIIIPAAWRCICDMVFLYEIKETEKSKWR